MLGNIIGTVVGSVAKGLLGSGDSGGGGSRTQIVQTPDYGKFLQQLDGGRGGSPTQRPHLENVKKAEAVGDPKNVAKMGSDTILLSKKWDELLKELMRDN